MSNLTGDATIIILNGVKLGTDVPADIKSAIEKETNTGKTVDTTLGTLNALSVFAEMAAKASVEIPYVPGGGVIDAVSLGKNCLEANNDFQRNGFVSDGKWMEIAGDAVGVVSALGACVAAAVSTPVSVPVLAFGLVASAGLSVTGMMQSPDDRTIQDYWSNFRRLHHSCYAKAS